MKPLTPSLAAVFFQWCQSIPLLFTLSCPALSS